jgi:hypothetical protein
MSSLDIENVNIETYKILVKEFLDREAFLIRTVNTVIAEVSSKHPTATNGLLVSMVTDGGVEFYFKECTDSLLVCTVDILNMNVIGSKLDEKVRTTYLTSLKHKYNFIESEESKLISRRKRRKEWWFTSKKKHEEYDKLLQDYAITKLQIWDYIKYLEDREEIMLDITHDIIDILNNSEHLDYIRFSKLFRSINL